MEFHSAKQISPDNLITTNYDLFILVAGYENRSVYIPLHYKEIKADIKVALAFEEKSNESQRKSNDTFLQNQGFRFIPVSGEGNLDIEPLFDEIFRKSEKDHIHVLIDYSSMTKVWYSSLINYLIGNSKTCSFITVHFTYTPANYSEPKKASPVKYNNKISYPSRKETDLSRQTALIIGLGLDKAKPELLKKSLAPALTMLLYADPSNEVKYVEKVFKNNQDIIEQTEVRNLISFPLFNMDLTNEILTDLCLKLREKYNVVIAPVGPKVLSLLALLLSSRYPDISVIRVSSGSNAPVFDRLAFGLPLVYSVEFVSDEMEI